jgi:hypothetical protein
MAITEFAYKQIKTLPETQVREVLDFIGYLREKGECLEWENLMGAQAASLAAVWDNADDEVWNDRWAQRLGLGAVSVHRFPERLVLGICSRVGISW